MLHERMNYACELFCDLVISDGFVQHNSVLFMCLATHT